MGILEKQDMESVKTLQGSDTYNKSARDIALILFIAFASNWEDKKALTPPKLQWIRKPRKSIQIRPPKTRPPLAQPKPKRPRQLDLPKQ